MTAAPSASGLLARLQKSGSHTTPHAAARSALLGAAVLLLSGQLCFLLCAGSASQPAVSSLSPAAARLTLNPNSASAAELNLLPGIGPGRAAAIIAYRLQTDEPRAFRSVFDLDRVRGIGPATVAQIAPWIDLPDAADALQTAHVSASR